jgi:hypothetical protein
MLKNQNLDIKIPNIGLLLIPYMFLQYLAVPFYNFAFYGTNFKISFYIGLLGILFFLIGVYFSNKLLFNNKINNKINFIDYDIFLHYGIGCLILGFSIKFKSCFALADSEYCIDHVLSQILRPNYLYLAGSLFISIYLIFKIRFESRSIIIRKLALLLTLNIILFLMLVIISGVGRSLSVYYLVSLFLFLYSIDVRFRKIKYICTAIITLVFFWVVLSFFKSLIVEYKDFNNILGINFITVKVINRFSQYHILDLIYENWPKNHFMYFNGVSDFFTLPSVGINREYLNGNDFGHAIKVISDNDFVTGVAPTFIGDLYIRGGITATIIGMYFIGITYDLIFKIINRLQGSTRIGIMVIIYPYLIYCTEDFIFLSLSTALIMFLFYYNFFIILKKVTAFLK